MEKRMMIDYRNENGDFVRRIVDDCEFCVRRGFAWFISEGTKYSVPLEDVSQVFFA